jgi:hypothetical protein
MSASTIRLTIACMAVKGSNFGWPYCFYDYGEKKLLLKRHQGKETVDEGAWTRSRSTATRPRSRC